jgi:hypothetical protein
MTDEQETTSAPTETPAATGLQKDSIWEVYWPGDPNVEREAIRIASFPMIIYFWPAMILFLVCGVVQSFSTGEMPSVTLGWLATGMLAFNLMVIVTDLDQKKFIIALLVLALGGLGAWITTLKDIGFMSSVMGWLGELNLGYTTHTYYTIFFLLWFFFCLGMLNPRFNYWRLESNEFVHYIQPWGRDQSVPRLGSTVTREVPDVLELLLTFGGGTLVIRRDNQVVARIEHVPFLGRRMVAVEKLLGVTRVKQV